jgi:hypothetical protein
MEVERLKRMVKIWETDPKGAVSVTDCDSAMANVILKSR